MIVNGIKFDFNGTTLEGLKKVEDAIATIKPMQDEAQELVAAGHLVEGAEKSIEAVRTFFLEVTGIDVVGDCDSPVKASIYMEDFNTQVDKQKKAIRDTYYKGKR